MLGAGWLECVSGLSGVCRNSGVSFPPVRLGRYVPLKHFSRRVTRPICGSRLRHGAIPLVDEPWEPPCCDQSPLSQRGGFLVLPLHWSPCLVWPPSGLFVVGSYVFCALPRLLPGLFPATHASVVSALRTHTCSVRIPCVVLCCRFFLVRADTDTDTDTDTSLHLASSHQIDRPADRPGIQRTWSMGREHQHVVRCTGRG